MPVPPAPRTAAVPTGPPGTRSGRARVGDRRDAVRVPRPVLPEAKPGVEFPQQVGVVQLCRQHRSDAQGEYVAPPLGCETVQHLHDRQVRRAPRLVQPLLADRPGAVVSEPRQGCGARCSTCPPMAMPSPANAHEHEVERCIDIVVARSRGPRCSPPSNSRPRPSHRRAAPQPAIRGLLPIAAEPCR